MEPEGSLPGSQELSTCTYPEPNQSSPPNTAALSKTTITDDHRQNRWAENSLFVSKGYSIIYHDITGHRISMAHDAS
jgi:hypothetical protein